MKRVRSAVLSTVCAALITALFVASGMATWVAEAQEKTTKVSYAPIPSGEYKIDPAHALPVLPSDITRFHL